jgi:hypothetical protein
VTEARCVVAGDINLPQNHYETFNILCTLLTVTLTYTSKTHTEHIFEFPWKKVAMRTLHDVALFVQRLSCSIRCEQLRGLAYQQQNSHG